MTVHSRSRKSLQPRCRTGDGGAGEAARFLAEHLSDLVVLARRHGFDTLAYLLEMAKLEADEGLRRPAEQPQR